MTHQEQIRQRITDAIVEALRAGTRPWVRPWVELENTGFPTNAVSGHRYSGINVLLLQLRGYQSRFWGTFRQWSDLGFQIKKRPADVAPGAWGTKVILYKPVTKTKTKANGEEKEERYLILREYTVFNAEQVTGPGVEEYQARPRSQAPFVDYQPAETAIAATKADIRYGGNRAFYRRGEDYIQLPPREAFVSPTEFYCTALHELCHWSEPRLKWEGSYGLGELRAEIGGCFLAAELGIPNSDDLTNHNAYLASWLKELENDPKAIFHAATAASKASDFVLSFSRSEKQGAEEHSQESEAVA